MRMNKHISQNSEWMQQQQLNLPTTWQNKESLSFVGKDIAYHLADRHCLSLGRKVLPTTLQNKESL